MVVGDLGFFYHSQTEKAVVGIATVIAEAHPDNTADDERWDCVDIQAVKSHLTLEMIKTDGRLDDMILVRNSRLSVQPVSDAKWKGSVANFHGWFAYCPDPGIAFAKSCRRGTLHDH
jgi:predicted RNA-binding protein with PUA-like domain